MISRKKNVYNNKIVSLFKNFFFVITSNLVSTLISIIVILFIPKFIGVAQYGYWQLYILYSSFVGLLHFGWNDGLYLRFGGELYEDLDKKLFFSQFYLLLFLQIILALTGLLILKYFNFSSEKIYIIKMTMLCMVIVNTRYFLLFLLQATYRIKEYSIVTIFDRVIYLVMIVCLLVLHFKSFELLIWVDILGKLSSLFLGVYFCKSIVFNFVFPISFLDAFMEMINNIRVGIKLMLSNIANKLVVGNVRFGIESVWSVAIFGKVSLMLSITSFFMLFIGSISLVLFPLLRRVEQMKLPLLYIPIREILTLFLLLTLFSYYPLVSFIRIWLPQYSDTSIYLLTILPTIIFEGKVSLLTNTYFKVLRKEQFLLKINIILLIISIVLTLISIFIIKSINAAVCSILLISCIKSILSELYIQKTLKISLWLSILIELILVVCFLVSNMFLSPKIAAIVYIFLIFIYIYIRKENLVKAYIYFKDSLVY